LGRRARSCMTDRRARVGLLGGSFDPPHLAHLALARVAVQALALDELLWLPAGQPWQKAGRPLADAAHRRAMVALLIEGQPGHHLDERELQRRGPTYTLDTVREIAAERPDAELFLVIGQDQYAGFPSWHGWRDLLPLVTLAVAAREGDEPRAPPELAALPHRVRRLALPRIDISATAIRAALAAGREIASMVGVPVARYIDQHSLYTQGTGS
jgi:nicotinate-nucleotide adenylyltransferase